MALTALVLALVGAWGCLGEAAPAEDAAADARPGLDAGDAGDALPGDSAPADTAVADTARPPAPELVLGTNAVGSNDPTAFVALEEHDALEVQLGFQGFWMVVLALKTRDIFTGPLRLEAHLSAGGAEQGSLVLGNQKLAPGGDGYAYFYNFFLVVADATVAGGEGVITFRASDAAGHERELTRTVELTGGE